MAVAGELEAIGGAGVRLGGDRTHDGLVCQILHLPTIAKEIDVHFFVPSFCFGRQIRLHVLPPTVMSVLGLSTCFLWELEGVEKSGGVLKKLLLRHLHHFRWRCGKKIRAWMQVFADQKFT